MKKRIEEVLANHGIGGKLRENTSKELEALFLKELEQSCRERENELLKIVKYNLTTHTEHDGRYCDTGEDMEWACRSECVEMAVKRIREAVIEMREKLKEYKGVKE